MIQVTVTIGRNVGDSPMAEDRWCDFRASIDDALMDSFKIDSLESIESHNGTGEWQGVREDSLKASVLFDSLDALGVQQLRERLAIIRDEFEQDAIALCIGDSELV